MLVEIYQTIARGLPTRREKHTAIDCVVFDTRGLFWTAFDTLSTCRVWSSGHTAHEARSAATRAFKERFGNDRPIGKETRIAPDGTYYVEGFPFVPGVVP
jgi:hypothetical protein